MHFEHKTTAGLPQYSLDNPLRAVGISFDQLALDLPCKRTSQRKLESSESSWHALAGSGLYVPLIYISFGQLALDRPCKRTSQRKLEPWHAGAIPQRSRQIPLH